MDARGDGGRLSLLVIDLGNDAFRYQLEVVRL